MSFKRCVITGMGIVSCIGNDRETVTRSLREGHSGITAAEDFTAYNFRSQIYGFPSSGIEDVTDRKIKRFMCRGTAWSYLAMRDAIADSGLEAGEIISPSTGVIVGSGGASTVDIYGAADITRNNINPKRIGPFAVPKTMSSQHSAVLAVGFGIRGVNYSISSACATSAHCIGNAAQLIRSGEQTIIFAGGGEDIHWSLASMFDAMGALSSKHNANPATASRPFDVNRDGFVIAGGAAILVLEERDHALARGAHIMAELVGYGYSSDGFDMVQPSGEGSVRCMRQALAGFDGKGIGEVAYINPHATSTPVGDNREVEAMREVFGTKIPPLSATKGLTGHSLGASGAQEAIYSLLMMEGNFMAASPHIVELDSEFADVPILRERRDDAAVDCVLSNSFGFGGTNCSLVFRKDAA